METTKEMPTPETLASTSKVGTCQQSLISYSTATGEEISSIFSR